MNPMKLVTPVLLCAALAIPAASAEAQQRLDGRSISPLGPQVSIYLGSAPRHEKVGRLRLQIWPLTAEVYLDGIYAGSVEEFDGSARRLDLRPGSYRIDVRAPGHEPVRFNARIRRAQTTIFRGTLPPSAQNSQE